MIGPVSFPHTVLIVDDEASCLKSFEIALRAKGINNLICCQDSRDVVSLMERREIALVLLDLWMPHVPGERVLSDLVAVHPDVPVVIVTGVNEVEAAVKCMKAGAADYLVKPVEKERLVTTVVRALELGDLRCENARLKHGILSSSVENPAAFREIITNNAAMKAMFQYVEAIARSSQPVLVTGETGVGKELIARSLHTLSGMAGAFVPVNVAGVDETVFADTLFGHTKGAFTGADEARSGLVERAEAGTLFLDEIGELSKATQLKLLRLLQEREYFRLGSDVARRTDARVVVATNRSVDELQHSADFRRDLFYRLRAHHVYVPPLRDRLDDLPLLVDHFLEQAARSLGKRKPTPPRELFSVLGTYGFPGNVRELRAMVFDAVTCHRAKMLSMDTFKRAVGIEGAAIPTSTEHDDDMAVVFAERLPTLQVMADLLVQEALRRADGNQTVAGQLLGISRQAVNRRLGRGRSGGRR